MPQAVNAVLPGAAGQPDISFAAGDGLDITDEGL